MQKSWMWQNEKSNGVEGVYIDTDKSMVQWFDEPGCACAGSYMEQTIADFRENGPRYIMPPGDVIEEMQQALAQVPSA